MISYEPLWQTMKERGVTTYTLIYKRGINTSTVQNLKKNKNINMYTLEKLCTILDCTPDRVVKFIPDPDPQDET